MVDEAPAESAQLLAEVFAPGEIGAAIVVAQTLGAAGDELLAGFRIGEFGTAGIGKLSSAGSAISTTWPRRPRRASGAIFSMIASASARKSPISTMSLDPRIMLVSGKPSASGACRMAVARRSAALRAATGSMTPGQPMRSPERARISASASISTSARLSLETEASVDLYIIDGERSAQSQTVWAASHSRSRI
jgi:hypothetical protein